MPPKNTIKTYVEDSYYHIYNRGVNKNNIFKNPQDYAVFQNYLKTALTSPPDAETQRKQITIEAKNITFSKIPRLPKNFHDEIHLLAYCLMPNHYHLLIKQIKKESMESFMRSLITRYSMYFNKKYDRVGTLFQGTYKASLVDSDEYLLHLSRYIHLNAQNHQIESTFTRSSYQNYLKPKITSWVETSTILKFFNNKSIPEIRNTQTYKDFVEKSKTSSEDILGNLTMETD